MVYDIHLKTTITCWSDWNHEIYFLNYEGELIIYKKQNNKLMKYIIDEDKLHQLFTTWRSEYRGHLLNQAEKSQKIGVSQSVISRLENRSKKFGELKSHHFIKMCNCLGIHPAEILKAGVE